jgi:hypothetical protein
MKHSFRRPVWILTGLLAAMAGAACEQTRSHTPLSPLIAGPLNGVNITQPALLEPEANRRFKPSQQPITLVMENPASTSPRPYTLRIELSADAQFSTAVASRDGLAPGANGRTSFQIPDALPAGRIYYWRVRAEDGANTGAYSAPRAFEVLEPVVIGAPIPRSPIGSGRITTRRPTLTVANATVTGPHLPIRYHWEVATDQSFGNRVVFEETQAGALETPLTVPSDLATNTMYYWRVRVTDSEVTGNWSVTEAFQTPLAASGGGTGPSLPPGNCATNNGDALVQCIAAKYPSYLAAGVSSHDRESNMAFLRDRVIEAGICGGMDLAWNKKRGNGPHSIDALAWRTPGGAIEVVDIGVGYDDTSQTLRLQWAIVAGPQGYDGFPRPNCG